MSMMYGVPAPLRTIHGGHVARTLRHPHMLPTMRHLSPLARAARTLSPTASRMGARALATRSESDAFGPIDVDDAALWGAQTQRR